ncbi:hypothetical protein EsH8_X_000737 [Colletotrichum jinshuiense]
MKASLVTALSLLTIAESVVPGYNVVDLEWEVESAPGNGFVSVNGTIESIVAEMTKVNPNFRDDYGLDNTTLTTELFEARDALEKRQAVVSEFSHKCFDPWGPADRDEIRKGIDYLYKVNGRPKNGPGPGNCGRVSCSNNAAIWWCNDDPTTKTLFSFVSIGNGAWRIHQNCQQYRGGTYFYYATGGQAFHPTNWNVITNLINNPDELDQKTAVLGAEHLSCRS